MAEERKSHDEYFLVRLDNGVQQMPTSSCCVAVASLASEFWYRSCSRRSWFCRFHFVRRFWYLLMRKIFYRNSSCAGVSHLTTFSLASQTNSVDSRPHRDPPQTSIFGNEIFFQGKRVANEWKRFAAGDSVLARLCCLTWLWRAESRVGACLSRCSWTCLPFQCRFPGRQRRNLISSKNKCFA